MNSQSIHFEPTHDALRLDSAGCSQRGTGRENNEDCIYIAPNREALFVADGVGGNLAGNLTVPAQLQDEQKRLTPARVMLDGADSSLNSLPVELAPQQERASDPAVDLESRIEAFEDIIDSEVGDTDFIRARNLERFVSKAARHVRHSSLTAEPQSPATFGDRGSLVAGTSGGALNNRQFPGAHDLRQLFLKFDGGNPTGSQKDRIAFAQAMDAVRRGFDTICVATCGNYGAAMSLAAELAGLRCVIFIPDGYHSKRLTEMVAHHAEIIRTTGDYEAAVEAARDRSLAEEWYDANPGGANVAIQLAAYGQIAWEIYDELRDAPAVLAVPVSNGTTLAGIWRGFVSLYRRGKTSRLPKMVAGSSFRKNPIVSAFLNGHIRCEDLNPGSISETETNEPLINWHSIDGDHALEAIRSTDGWAGHATDRVMKQYSRILREQQGLSVLPASTAGLIALLERHQHDPLPGDRYVAVLTGRRA